jgi:hypothetical protein
VCVCVYIYIYIYINVRRVAVLDIAEVVSENCDVIRLMGCA